MTFRLLTENHHFKLAVRSFYKEYGLLSVSLRRIIISNDISISRNNGLVTIFPSPYGESSFQIAENATLA